MHEPHVFDCLLEWTGAGKGGFAYETYSRDLRLELPGKLVLDASSAPAFRGDASRANPEDLVVAALSSCHALSYLAIMARARLPVLGYADRAQATLAEENGILKLVSATLRPHVILPRNSPLDRARTFHGQANRECFIARSVNFPVHHEPTFEER